MLDRAVTDWQALAFISFDNAETATAIADDPTCRLAEESRERA